MSKKVCLHRFFASQTFPIVLLVIIPSVSKFVISLTVMLHIAYLTRQEAGQAFIPSCKSMIDFVNLLVNKRLKFVSFYNILADLAPPFVTFC